MAERNTYTDVLIIGAGPAGRVLAAYLSRQNLKSRIIEKRKTRVLTGQADGLSARSSEIFQSLGILPQILKDSASMSCGCVWLATDDGQLKRSETWDPNEGVPTYQAMLGRSQGLIEKDLEEAATRYSGTGVEYGMGPTDLKIDHDILEDENAYPVKVALRHLRDHESSAFQSRSHRKQLGESVHKTCNFSSKVDVGQENDEIVHAKYAIGCDGAWSWVRDQLKITMTGESRSEYWGVIDIIPVTDFPDKRRQCIIQNVEASILWIPREHGLVRIYTQIHVRPMPGTQRLDRSSVTVDQIFSQARKNLAPYKLDYVYCDWWTVYQTRQSIASSFSDPHMRVFLAGDAIHTHSPLVGLGMNTSIADAWNLAWKLAAVINKQSPREVLSTYQTERMPSAENLVFFDRLFSRSFSGKPSPEELQVIGEEGALLGPGTETVYNASVITSDLPNLPSTESVPRSNNLDSGDEITPYTLPHPNISLTHPLASKLHIGRRTLPGRLKHQDSLAPSEILSQMPADGRWRLIVFAGNILDEYQLGRLNTLGEGLSASDRSTLKNYTHVLCMPLERPFEYANGLSDMDSIQPLRKTVPLLDVLTIHSCTSVEANLVDLHPSFITYDPVMGRDDGRVFVDDDIYESYGVEQNGAGCIVLCRPDQHVAWVGALEDVQYLESFLEGCLCRSGP